MIEDLRTVCGGPFSFSVNAGECLALSGPSGCGKSLLLRALADLDPAEGSVQLDGTNRNEMAAPAWRKKVGWLPAESAWWYDHVGDHFRDQRSEIRGQKRPPIGRRQGRQPTKFAASRSAEMQRSYLEPLGFGEDVLRWRVDRLSTGEKQRLAVCRLLFNQPQALLLDEPTAALDPVNVTRVEEMVERVRKLTSASVIWVSHDPDQMERVAARHLVFADGRLEEAQ